MHKKYEKQLPLPEAKIDHPKAKELDAISQILDQNPAIYELALKDIICSTKIKAKGANGMTAEQVVRAAIIKHMNGYSYEELEFHLADSKCYRNFCRLGLVHKSFKKSALANNIKAISAESWEAIHRILITDASAKSIETGRKVRIDCTVVSADIHEPTDSSLLLDSVRVLTRILGQAKENNFPCQDHSKRAKRRALGIMNAKNDKVRKNNYIDLLKVTRKTIGYAKGAVVGLKNYPGAEKSCRELEHYIELASKVASQTEQRVVRGESVCAEDKIVSIFEPHSDIIKKDRRETFYGHKICLTGGASNLILDCVILEGNPADSTLSDQMLDRQKDIYGRYPLKAALDGGFASQANLRSAKAKGVSDVCFSKGRGLTAEVMCRSTYVYKLLRNFRAGIESGISWLKRSFGLGRCLWKGFPSFKSYVWSAIVSANLVTIARRQLA